mgnify:CR=1 FL=1
MTPGLDSLRIDLSGQKAKNPMRVSESCERLTALVHKQYPVKELPVRLGAKAANLVRGGAVKAVPLGQG